MTAQVLAIRASAASTSGWSSQELAEVFRLGEMLHKHGVDLAISYGVSDEGDPWLVLTDPLDAEISFHIARIDHCYVIARGDSEEITTRRHMREVAEVLLPSRPSETLILGSASEPLELYAVVALAIANSESLTQAPIVKQALETAVLAERTNNGREAQRETTDRIGELARILIAAANLGESDTGRAALSSAAQLPGLPAPIAQPAHQVVSQVAPRFALPASVELAQVMAPGQRDLAHVQSMIAGLAAGTAASWTDAQQQASTSTVPVTAPKSAAAAPLSVAMPAHAAAAEIGTVPTEVIAPPSQIAGAKPIPDILVPADPAGQAHDIAGVPVPSVVALQTAGLGQLAQILDFSAERTGVRVTLSDAAATILGSHGFDVFTVSGQNLVRIGDGGALVSIISGDNIIVGSNAASIVNIQGGHNSVAGGGGTQTVNIEHGTNTVAGGSGTQVVNIAGGTNTVVGGSGGTVVNVTGGVNSVTGGGGNNTVNVADGQNTIVAGAGTDTIHLTGGTNTVVGGGGNSIIGIEGGQTTVIGGGGHDSVSIGGSASIVGSSGVNIIVGSANGTLVNVGDTTSQAAASAPSTTDAGIGVVGGAPAAHSAAASAVNPTS